MIVYEHQKNAVLEHFAEVLDWWDNREEIEIDGFPKAKKYSVETLLNEMNGNLDLCGYPHEEEEILAPMDLINQYQEKRTALNAEIDSVLTQITFILGDNKI